MITQYGTIPYRIDESGALRILLITSRETRRWVIPRGNPISGLLPHETAAQEAFEEAGIYGTTSVRALGRYHYRKRRKLSSSIRAEVHVFPLLVRDQAESWPEMHEREVRWFEHEAAARAVEEPGLRRLILALPAMGEQITQFPDCEYQPTNPPIRRIRNFVRMIWGK